MRTNGEIVAMSVISDDHGQTWTAGREVPVARGEGEPSWRFDENKAAELSDGRLILNSRATNASPGGGHRIVALSEDGGATWGEPFAETQLLDSGNNAQVIRAYLNAAPGSARAKVLLYSGAFNQGARTSGTVLASCDDGKTWSHRRELIPGGTGYTTMAVQPDGSIGMLYEPRIFHDVAYLRFTLADIAPGLCEAPAVNVDGIDDVTVTDGEEINPLAVVLGGGDPALERTVSVNGLPHGLSYDAQSGTTSGRVQTGIAKQKTYHVTVSVLEQSDGTGLAPREASTSFDLTILPRPGSPEPSGKPDEPGSPEPSEPSEPSEPEQPGKPEPSEPEQPGAVSTARAADKPRTTRATGLARTGASAAALVLVAACLGGAVLLVRRGGKRS